MISKQARLQELEQELSRQQQQQQESQRCIALEEHLSRSEKLNVQLRCVNCP